MSQQAEHRLLDLRAMMAMEHLRFTTRYRIEGAFSGRHESRQQGGAGEFVDYREYVGGEDLRRLDWKMLARSGRAYVRLFQDETNLVCTIAIDASGSMLFGKSSGYPGRDTKLQYVQFLATALSYVIGRGQDQVGFAVLGQRLLHYLPPGSTQSHLNRIYGAIEHIEPRPTTRMAEALRELFERSSRRGVLVLLSDFLMEDFDQVLSAIRLFRHRHWEVLALHVVHPLEERMPEGTAFRFEGLEDEGIVDCSPAELANEYRVRFNSHLEAVRSSVLASGCEYKRVSTAISYLKTLRGFLVERSG